MSLSQVLSRLTGGEKSFARGVHPHDWKELAREATIQVLASPAEVVVPMVQHIGAPCAPTVKPRQDVAAGEVVGDAEAFVSAPVHTPIAGAAQMQTMVTLPNGRHVPAVPVKADGEQLTGQSLWDDVFGGDWPVDALEEFSGEQIVQAARDAGLVGMGGAGFPTHVKLRRNPDKPVDVLLVNGCECEPYLTADDRLMIEAPEPIITGSLLAARAVGAERVAIVVEGNKPEAIDKLTKAAAATDIEIIATATKYPQGGEKQLVLAAIGREVPTGGLPLDCGVVVVNVGTAAALARAVLRGKPLTHRIVTVSGRGVDRPGNFLAAVGVSYGSLIEAAGGLTANASRVVAGGPMMGMAITELDTPITKGTSGVTVLTAEDLKAAEETACVKCGRCADVCPLNLVPTRIALACRRQEWDLAEKFHMTACMECGCCAYACPARLPLVQIIRAGKATAPK